jgi:hypothetical protein
LIADATSGVRADIRNESSAPLKVTLEAVPPETPKVGRSRKNEKRTRRAPSETSEEIDDWNPDSKA